MNSILIRYREHTPAEAECRSVAMRYGIDRSMSAPGVLIVATLFGTSVGTVAALLIRGDVAAILAGCIVALIVRFAGVQFRCDVSPGRAPKAPHESHNSLSGKVARALEQSWCTASSVIGNCRHALLRRSHKLPRGLSPSCPWRRHWLGRLSVNQLYPKWQPPNMAHGASSARMGVH